MLLEDLERRNNRYIKKLGKIKENIKVYEKGKVINTEWLLTQYAMKFKYTIYSKPY